MKYWGGLNSKEKCTSKVTMALQEFIENTWFTRWKYYQKSQHLQIGYIGLDSSNRIRSRSQRGLQSIMTVCMTSLASQVTDLRTLWFIKRGTVSYVSPFWTIRNLLFFIFAVNWPCLGQSGKYISEICLSLMHGTYAVFIRQSWVNYT